MIGRTLGHYKVGEKLGAGGMGEVFRANDTRLHRDVALKFLVPSSVGSAQALERFQREARAAAQLNHPNICTIYDVGEEDGQPYIAMELMEGAPLSQHLAAGAVPLAQMLEWAAQIADALDAAHAKSIVHRDIKPANLFVTKRGEIKVLDFGLAKPVQQELGATALDQAPTISVPEQLTSPGAAVGTVAYMSPEQVRGELLDARSDLFSFGVVMYEMATGRRPFDGKTSGVIFNKILSDTPSAPTMLRDGLPDKLDGIIGKALEKELPLRSQSAAELRADLKRLQRDSGSSRLAATEKASVVRRGDDIVVNVTSDGQPMRFVVPAWRVTLQKWVLLAVVGVALTFAFNVGGLRTKIFGTVESGPIDSIAVLPFENASGDPDTEYLSDGISESLINKLSKLGSLRVIPWSSVTGFKENPDPQTAREKLNVRAVLVGRVRQRGDELTISVELIDTEKKRQLWGEQYNRPMTGIFAVQESIARDISRQLKLQLTPEEETALTKRGTESTEAYQLYLRGRYHWNKYTGEGVNRSIGYFLQAIDQDPGYAEAYAGLAYAYHLIGAGYGYRDLSPKEAYPKARAAVQKALEIDETLGQAHGVLAAIHFNYDWDWAGAGREFQRAIELDPNYATAHLENGWYLIVLGRFDEALTEMERALDLDPLSVVINSDIAAPYFFASKYDTAIELSRKALEMDPNFAVARLRLAWAYLRKGMHKEAITELERAVVVIGDNTEAVGFLGYAYARFGETDKALRVLNDMQGLSEKGFVQSFGRALIYVGLGEKDQALVWLEKAYEEREPSMPYLNVMPWFDPLRDEPRFQELLRKMNFPKE